jgi:gamma-glutamyltranspeptidase/glutathione hydrolase
VTRDGELHAVLGTMGGDTQPQVVLQLLARLLHAGQSVGAAVRAPRWALGEGGFSVWDEGDLATTVEWDGPESWASGLADRGHRVVRARRDANFGHAHVIVRRPDGVLAGAADPRALSGSASGY